MDELALDALKVRQGLRCAGPVKTLVLFRLIHWFATLIVCLEAHQIVRQ